MAIYQSYPDTFSKPRLYPSQLICTNKRYKNFTQTHFTAGDIEQFLEYCDLKLTEKTGSRKKEDEWNSIWKWDFYSKYSCRSEDALTNTFKYMFYKFKKGIFIKIQDGRLKVFLPFSNAHFVNEWYSRIKDIPLELKQSHKVLPTHLWFANDYLVRFENPPIEGDKGHSAIKHMLEEMCRFFPNMPNIECFINRRDFPLLKKDGTEAYESIFGKEQPLLSHSYDHYLPILSMVSHPDFADIPIPTPEDWARVGSTAKTPFFFMGTKRTLDAFSDSFLQDWEKKKPIAVFRGSNTGSGLRIQLCQITADDPLFDTGITSFSERYKYVNDTIRAPDSMNMKCSKFMSLKDQSRYKFIIHVQGHVQSYRLSAELATGSVILLVECDYKLWFESKLIPWKHFVPIASDLSNLKERLHWCLNNDEECKKIAKTARLFYDTLLTRKGCLNYLYDLFCFIHRNQTIHPSSDLNINPPKHDLFVGNPNVSLVNKSRCYFSINKKTEEGFCLGAEIFSSFNTQIQIIQSERIVSKTSKANLFHEAQIGIHCINELLRVIPNFVFSYGYKCKSNHLYIEYVQGKTLQKYILSKEFIFQDWLCMLKELSLAFAVAQKRCLFTHHDACPWNIIVYEHEKEQVFDYAVEEDFIVRVQTKRSLVLIDYGRSSAMTQKGFIHQSGGFEPFKDCLCVLISSAYLVICYQRIHQTEQKDLIDLFNNCFSARGSPYFRPIKSFDELKVFLERNHNFSNLTFAPKGTLLEQSPLLLYDSINVEDQSAWIFTKVSHVKHVHLGKISGIKSLKDFGDPLFERYALQQIWLMTLEDEITEEWSKRPINHMRLCIREFSTDKGTLNTIRHPSYNQVYNMLFDMLVCGGPLALTEQEKICAKELLECVKKHMLIN